MRCPWGSASVQLTVLCACLAALSGTTAQKVCPPNITDDPGTPSVSGDDYFTPFWKAETPLLLFDFETKILSPETLATFPRDIARLLRFDASPANASLALDDVTLEETPECKAFPGDKDWPAEQLWREFNATLGGALIKTVPRAAVCYEGEHYDEARCAEVTKDWANSYVQVEDPVEPFAPEYQGMTCQPPTIYNSGNCTLGGYPMYTVNASSVLQVQLAVNFARNTNVRLVIKNTGHDFNGKSTGAGSLNIWTHHLREIDFIRNYTDDLSFYRGPAMKAGSGALAWELFKVASDNNVVVVGGEAQTVGLTGGYIQGGGHSPLSSLYGMAADQVLSMELIAADGRFVHASSTDNPDLFWALRGGGGSTFGVVTSVMIKAHPEMPVSTGTLQFTSSGIGRDIFWQGVDAFFSEMPAYTDAGAYAYFFVTPMSVGTSGGLVAPDLSGAPNADDILVFSLQPFFAPNISLEDTRALLQPFLVRLEALQIPFAPNISHYDTFYQAWQASFPLEPVSQIGVAPSSRLFPRHNWYDPALLNATLSSIRAVSDAGHPLIGLMLHPSLERAEWAQNSVNPAWRSALLHATAINSWPANATAQQKFQVRRNFVDAIQKWRDLSPSSGAYLAEADRLEPDWQEAFYGGYYDKLVRVKRIWDPRGVFYATTGVGSADWEIRAADSGNDGGAGAAQMSGTGRVAGPAGMDGAAGRMDAIEQAQANKLTENGRLCRVKVVKETIPRLPPIPGDIGTEGGEGDNTEGALQPWSEEGEGIGVTPDNNSAGGGGALWRKHSSVRRNSEIECGKRGRKRKLKVRRRRTRWQEAGLERDS